MENDMTRSGCVARAGAEPGSLEYQHIEPGQTPDRRAEQMDELLELAKGHLAAVARKLGIVDAQGAPFDGLRMGDFSFDYSDGAALTVKISSRAARAALGPENISSFRAFGKTANLACDLVGQPRLGIGRLISLTMMDITTSALHKAAALANAYQSVTRIVQRALINEVLEQAAVEPAALERFKMERERRALHTSVEAQEPSNRSAKPKI